MEFYPIGLKRDFDLASLTFFQKQKVRSMKKKFNKARKRWDIYAHVTNRIVADLEQGVRSWAKPWDTKHLAGNIIRPLRHNGLPYSGINILMLWVEAMENLVESSKR